MRATAILAGLALMGMAGCAYEPGGNAGAARSQVRIVGSSTVYPFTTAVAEQLGRRLPDTLAPIVESTGTGAGMKLFCQGVGARYPDVENASRRIKKSEVEDCVKNGVSGIIELQVGIDGIALGESVRGNRFELTEADVYRALAATPYGKPQTARTWRDVNPALPALPIRVYGPPPTSGTRDAFVELILEKGCDSDPAMKALKKSDEDRHKQLCTRIREDGAFIEAGENDNLIVQKLAANPDAIGIFGYSFIEENGDRIRGIPLQGVAPSYQTIADYSYPGARPLYVYIKAAHLDAVRGLRAFVTEYARAWNPGGYLTRRGLIPAPDDIRAKNAAVAARFAPLDLSTIS